MTKIPIIIDTDPGCDDTTAILMCLACEKFDVRAITSVGGNVGIEKTSNNARKIVELSGKDVKVAVGVKHPIVRKLVTAEYVHGISGLGNITLEEPSMPYYEKDAIDTIYEEAIKAHGKLRLLTLGPLTNIAVALLKYPKLKEMIDSIVFMGGAINLGNVTPAAEFNIYADPEAARIVFDSGIDMTMIGLDVTHETIVTKEQNKRLHKYNSKVAKVVAKLIDYTIDKENPYNDKGGVMHDPLAAATLIDSSVVETEDYYVDVELKSDITRGKTVTDVFRVTENKPNIHVAVKSDNNKFLDILEDMISKYE
ncbi:ribosylpyrimidine nucleosidase [Vallitalea longa]|uniref:Ribosylpyrimidine nucleosidase n=1 Tax=Vallitalea longa TaxID=2936439 RepID=A0A9W5YDL7_9FIRM|nr:nucleoside hydrolase [Vallitalea longa]GKX30413.1 ribosylpyrimidine nucleosidase [Vallitalea longa]